MRKIYPVIWLLLCGFTLSAYGQSNNKTAPQRAKPGKVECVSRLCQVLRAERDYNRAFMAPNETLIDELHTDDFVTTSGAPAQVTAKVDILGYMMEAGDKVRQVTSIYTLNLRVRFYGPTAVTTGFWCTAAKGEKGNEIIKNERFTRVWVRQRGRWRLATAHYSPTINPTQTK